MNQFLSSLGGAVTDWGAAGLLGVATVLLLTGKLLAKPTVDKIVAAREMYYNSMVGAKDSAFEAMKLYYEGRLHDLETAQVERLTDLRRIIDTQAAALQVSVDNNQKLIVQQDELLDLTRTVVPTVARVRNRVVNPPNDDRRALGGGQS